MPKGRDGENIGRAGKPAARNEQYGDSSSGIPERGPDPGGGNGLPEGKSDPFLRGVFYLLDKNSGSMHIQG